MLYDVELANSCDLAHARMLSHSIPWLLLQMGLKLDPLKATVHQCEGCLSSFRLLQGIVTNGVVKIDLHIIVRCDIYPICVG